MQNKKPYLQSMTKLFDMRDGYAPVRGILGMSDPSVHCIDGRWTMFIGAMGWSFKTNIICARLPEGAPLDSAEWSFEMLPGSGHRVKWLIPQPPRGSWNRFLHSVCYVKGMVNSVPVERIYHAGRTTENVSDLTTPYTIGFMEKVDGVWISRKQPLALRGTKEYPSILEPKVEYVNGRWCMRYLAIPGKTNKNTIPSYTILYSESADGEHHWTEPVVMFDTREGFFDSVVLPAKEDGYLMALTRDSNLESLPNYPPQGIWLSSSPTYSCNRKDWSSPVRVVDPSDDTDGWYANGMCSPTMQWGNTALDADTLYIFFVAATQKTSWLKESLRRLSRFQRPLVPSPFYFTIGRAEIRFDLAVN
ncbi:MAG TPA: hypothetical protein VFS21_24615 [Roseiflexaceae bacterium]|nr:hypothetical protein [Roseiflexaceae bacterium]